MTASGWTSELINWPGGTHLGQMPVVTRKPVRTSENATEMLRFDLETSGITATEYGNVKLSVMRCPNRSAILVQELDDQIDLATALGAITAREVRDGPTSEITWPF